MKKILLCIVLFLATISIFRIALTSSDEMIYFKDGINLITEVNNIGITIPQIEEIHTGIAVIDSLIQIPQWLLWIAQSTLNILIATFRFIGLLLIN